MAIRFRKSFKVAPGIRVNVSKSGMSTSIGKKGLTANLSKKGTRVTAGIPGTGLSASKLYAKGGGQKAEFLGHRLFPCSRINPVRPFCSRKRKV